jgi:hypothetical protein
MTQLNLAPVIFLNGLTGLALACKQIHSSAEAHRKKGSNELAQRRV